MATRDAALRIEALLSSFGPQETATIFKYPSLDAATLALFAAESCFPWCPPPAAMPFYLPAPTTVLYRNAG